MVALALPHLSTEDAVALLSAPPPDMAADALCLLHPCTAAPLISALLASPAEAEGVFKLLPASFVGTVYAVLGHGEAAVVLADVRPLCPVAHKAKTAWERVYMVRAPYCDLLDASTRSMCAR